VIKSSAILEINLKNLIYNYIHLKKIAKNSFIGATIKANAYGIGDKEVFSCLYKNGCRHFFVATSSEGINLRRYFKKGKIYILNGLENNNVKIFKKNMLIPILNTEQEIKLINKSKIKFGLHIETGLNRLGINLKKSIEEIKNNSNITIIISHLASSEKKNSIFNKIQNNNFKIYKKIFKNKNIVYSLSNSMGINLGKEFHYNLVRPGISLYGGHYFTKMKKIVKPIVKLKAKILQIKQIKKNEYVGYNQTYKASRNLSVAVIGIGYGDGISRKLGNKGHIYYKNFKFKIIGRVSMDSITIDITKNKKIFKIGKYVEILNYKHGIDTLAKECDTISNEILTSISKRVERIYQL
tara:strand:+ start:326 stop:1384 length:1059 start_codon:yes stop_codon:yes gene_type:complete